MKEEFSTWWPSLDFRRNFALDSISARTIACA
jgi:hypothetical protein